MLIPIKYDIFGAKILYTCIFGKSDYLNLFVLVQGAFIWSILATENSSALIRETLAKPTKNSICDMTGTPC